jgi:MoaA/NifB/PqqE/SkfB family radical SAM enzyme
MGMTAAEHGTGRGARIPGRARAALTLVGRSFRLYAANGSLRAWGRAVRCTLGRLIGRARPVWVTLGVTYRCQCRCAHCCVAGQRDDSRTDLTTDEARSVIDQVAGLGALQVTFSGGEPLLRSDLPELIAYARRRGLLTRVYTNALLLDRDCAARLKRAGLTHCAVSIDDVDPRVHDASRGLAGCHEKALAGIRNVRECGIPCQVLALAARPKVTEGLEKIIDLARELGALAVCVVFPYAAGRLEDERSQLLTPDEKARVWALQDSTFVHCEVPTPHSRCRVVARSHLYVSPYGDVAPCATLPFTMGNVRWHDLRLIWRRYCRGPALDLEGECVGNAPEARRRVKDLAQSVLASFDGPLAPPPCGALAGWTRESTAEAPPAEQE